MHIAVLAYHGCVASGVYGFADILAVANHIKGSAFFKTSVLSKDGQQVSVFSGPPILPEASTDAKDDWDVVYIPPAFGLTAPDNELVHWVRRAHSAGAVAAAACAGVFFLAEAGILASRPATTHWGLAEQLAATHPDITLLTQQMLIDGGDYICAGGVTSCFDLALHLVTRFASPELTAECSRALILDTGRVQQTPYFNLCAASHHDDEAVARAEQWLMNNYNHPVCINELAQHINVSERTLHRRFKQSTGRTPNAYLQGLRIEKAKRILESSSTPVTCVMHAVGYQDAPAFFRLFKSLTGLTPGEYRKRFGLFTLQMAR